MGQGARQDVEENLVTLGIARRVASTSKYTYAYLHTYVYMDVAQPGSYGWHGSHLPANHQYEEHTTSTQSTLIHTLHLQGDALDVSPKARTGSTVFAATRAVTSPSLDWLYASSCQPRPLTPPTTRAHTHTHTHTRAAHAKLHKYVTFDVATYSSRATTLHFVELVHTSTGVLV